MTPKQLESHDFRVTIGAPVPGRDPRPGECTQPYLASILNISAMSFGALSGNAIEALNAGAKRGNFAHDTGEGSISAHHRVHGGDLIWEIGSGYFGCRNDDGTFNAERFAANATDPQVRMIELKLSQVPSPARAACCRGQGDRRDCRGARYSGGPELRVAGHPQRLLVTDRAAAVHRAPARTVGRQADRLQVLPRASVEWFGIVKAMMETGITPDFIVVDGSEGGTGAAPVEFIDHVGVPLQEALLLVHNTLLGADLRHRVKLGCAGKVISAFDVARA